MQQFTSDIFELGLPVRCLVLEETDWVPARNCSYPPQSLTQWVQSIYARNPHYPDEVRDRPDLV